MPVTQDIPLNNNRRNYQLALFGVLATFVVAPLVVVPLASAAAPLASNAVTLATAKCAVVAKAAANALTVAVVGLSKVAGGLMRISVVCTAGLLVYQLVIDVAAPVVSIITKILGRRPVEDDYADLIFSTINAAVTAGLMVHGAAWACSLAYVPPTAAELSHGVALGSIILLLSKGAGGWTPGRSNNHGPIFHDDDLFDYEYDTDANAVRGPIEFTYQVSSLLANWLLAPFDWEQIWYAAPAI